MLDPYVVVEYLPSLLRGLMVTILFTVGVACCWAW